MHLYALVKLLGSYNYSDAAFAIFWESHGGYVGRAQRHLGSSHCALSAYDEWLSRVGERVWALRGLEFSCLVLQMRTWPQPTE